MVTRWEVTKAVRASDLPSSSRLVMLTLADVADTGTAEIPARFTPSLSVLSRETGLDRRTIQRHLAALEASGWVVRRRPDAQAQWAGERVGYRLDLPGDMEPPLAAGHHPPGGTETPGVVAQSPNGGGIKPPLETDHSDQSQINPSPPKAAGRGRPTDDPDFDRFWAAYPKKADKGHALDMWRRHVTKGGADPEAVIGGAQRYRDDPRRKPDYTKNAGTWLNGLCWEDQPVERSRSSSSAWWDN